MGVGTSLSNCTKVHRFVRLAQRCKLHCTRCSFVYSCTKESRCLSLVLLCNLLYRLEDSSSTRVQSTAQRCFRLSNCTKVHRFVRLAQRCKLHCTRCSFVYSCTKVHYIDTNIDTNSIPNHSVHTVSHCNG